MVFSWQSIMIPRYHPETMKLNKVISWQARKFWGQSLMITVFRPETMKLTKRFCRGSRGVVFSKRTPLAAGGKKVISWQARMSLR
jgi:hypothetical protein